VVNHAARILVSDPFDVIKKSKPCNISIGYIAQLINGSEYILYIVYLMYEPNSKSINKAT
jgi:hypothetical protein